MRRAHALHVVERRIRGRRYDAGVSALSSLWPAMTLTWSAAVAALVVGDVSSPVRPFVVIPFLALFPGAALVRHLRIRDPFANVAVAIALSFAIAGLTSVAMLYAGAWSPPRALGLLVAITVVATILETVHPRRAALERDERAPALASASASADGVVRRVNSWASEADVGRGPTVR